MFARESCLILRRFTALREMLSWKFAILGTCVPSLPLVITESRVSHIYIYLIVSCLQIKAIVFYTTRKRYKVLFVCCQQMRFEAKICFSSENLLHTETTAVELSVLIIITKEELVNVPFPFAIPLNKQRLPVFIFKTLSGVQE